jgi:2-polyprenyl-3-methyl-5-hydroxy-6-metoxy-1,4-benzoquinol methylase
MFEATKLEFNKIHTEKKRLLLKEMMTAVALETIEKFEQETRLQFCPCCRSCNINFFIKKFEYEMNRCCDCGHIFTNPMPSEDALNHYYNSQFKDFENNFFLDSFEDRIPIFLQRLELLKNIGAGHQILDIGSAVGIFLAANSRFRDPFEITACDISKGACDILKIKFPKASIINKNVIDLKPSNFDVVTLWDTFEHITDPQSLLGAISSQLKADGLFVFSTPNTSSLEWKVMEAEHVQLLPPGHVNLYNVENIKIILAMNGFSVIKIETLNPSLDLSYLVDVFNDTSLNETPSVRASRILLEALLEQDLFSHVTSKFRDKKFAGNMVVSAQKSN